MPKSRSEAPAFHAAKLSPREALLFEAGVKLGGAFHQYIGMPISAATAPDVARLIERALRLQPFVERARVTIDPSRGPPVGKGRFGYRYLTAEMLSVRVTLRDGPLRVVAELRHRPKLRYPLMSVTSIRAADH
jgi:dihydroneopterin aldolase